IDNDAERRAGRKAAQEEAMMYGSLEESGDDNNYGSTKERISDLKKSAYAHLTSVDTSNMTHKQRDRNLKWVEFKNSLFETVSKIAGYDVVDSKIGKEIEHINEKVSNLENKMYQREMRLYGRALSKGNNNILFGEHTEQDKNLERLKQKPQFSGLKDYELKKVGGSYVSKGLKKELFEVKKQKRFVIKNILKLRQMINEGHTNIADYKSKMRHIAGDTRSLLDDGLSQELDEYSALSSKAEEDLHMANSMYNQEKVRLKSLKVREKSIEDNVYGLEIEIMDMREMVNAGRIIYENLKINAEYGNLDSTLKILEDTSDLKSTIEKLAVLDADMKNEVRSIRNDMYQNNNNNGIGLSLDVINHSSAQNRQSLEERKLREQEQIDGEVAEFLEDLIN
ncbi:MAG: hypothetical protein KJ896_00350, partial [Nanoarchaeota archaeon]|nr:hypothetical protein [Nanoarchaeota archaeon]